MATNHPAGTPVADIRNFDRSTKVTFKCTKHPDIIWASKEPAVSSWFPVSAEPPINDECECKLSEFVTTREYTTR